MEFIVKCLILGGKYLTRVTAQSILEAFKKAVELRRTVQLKYDQSTCMAGSHQHMLEYYNSSLNDIGDNTQIQLAFVSDKHKIDFETYLKDIEEQVNLEQIREYLINEGALLFEEKKRTENSAEKSNEFFKKVEFKIDANKFKPPKEFELQNEKWKFQKQDLNLSKSNTSIELNKITAGALDKSTEIGCKNMNKLLNNIKDEKTIKNYDEIMKTVSIIDLVNVKGQTSPNTHRKELANKTKQQVIEELKLEHNNLNKILKLGKIPPSTTVSSLRNKSKLQENIAGSSQIYVKQIKPTSEEISEENDALKVQEQNYADSKYETKSIDSKECPIVCSINESKNLENIAALSHQTPNNFSSQAKPFRIKSRRPDEKSIIKKLKEIIAETNSFQNKPIGNIAELNSLVVKLNEIIPNNKIRTSKATDNSLHMKQPIRKTVKLQTPIKTNDIIGNKNLTKDTVKISTEKILNIKPIIAKSSPEGKTIKKDSILNIPNNTISNVNLVGIISNGNKPTEKAYKTKIQDVQSNAEVFAVMTFGMKVNEKSDTKKQVHEKNEKFLSHKSNRQIFTDMTFGVKSRDTHFEKISVRGKSTIKTAKEILIDGDKKMHKVNSKEKSFKNIQLEESGKQYFIHRKSNDKTINAKMYQYEEIDKEITTDAKATGDTSNNLAKVQMSNDKPFNIRNATKENKQISKVLANTLNEKVANKKTLEEKLFENKHKFPEDQIKRNDKIKEGSFQPHKIPNTAFTEIKKKALVVAEKSITAAKNNIGKQLESAQLVAQERYKFDKTTTIEHKKDIIQKIYNPKSKHTIINQQPKSKKRSTTDSSKYTIILSSNNSPKLMNTKLHDKSLATELSSKLTQKSLEAPNIESLVESKTESCQVNQLAINESCLSKHGGLKKNEMTDLKKYDSLMFDIQDRTNLICHNIEHFKSFEQTLHPRNQNTKAEKTQQELIMQILEKQEEHKKEQTRLSQEHLKIKLKTFEKEVNLIKVNRNIVKPTSKMDEANIIQETLSNFFLNKVINKTVSLEKKLSKSSSPNNRTNVTHISNESYANEKHFKQFEQQLNATLLALKIKNIHEVVKSATKLLDKNKEQFTQFEQNISNCAFEPTIDKSETTMLDPKALLETTISYFQSVENYLKFKELKNEIKRNSKILNINLNCYNKLDRKITRSFLDYSLKSVSQKGDTSLIPLPLECNIKIDQNDIKNISKVLEINKQVSEELENNLKIVKIIKKNKVEDSKDNKTKLDLMHMQFEETNKLKIPATLWKSKVHRLVNKSKVSTLLRRKDAMINNKQLSFSIAHVSRQNARHFKVDRTARSKDFYKDEETKMRAIPKRDAKSITTGKIEIIELYKSNFPINGESDMNLIDAMHNVIKRKNKAKPKLINVDKKDMEDAVVISKDGRMQKSFESHLKTKKSPIIQHDEHELKPILMMAKETYLDADDIPTDLNETSKDCDRSKMKPGEINEGNPNVQQLTIHTNSINFERPERMINTPILKISEDKLSIQNHPDTNETNRNVQQLNVHSNGIAMQFGQVKPTLNVTDMNVAEESLTENRSIVKDIKQNVIDLNLTGQKNRESNPMIQKLNVYPKGIATNFERLKPTKTVLSEEVSPKNITSTRLNSNEKEIYSNFADEANPNIQKLNIYPKSIAINHGTRNEIEQNIDINSTKHNVHTGDLKVKQKTIASKNISTPRGEKVLPESDLSRSRENIRLTQNSAPQCNSLHITPNLHKDMVSYKVPESITSSSPIAANSRKKIKNLTPNSNDIKQKCTKTKNNKLYPNSSTDKGVILCKIRDIQGESEQRKFSKAVSRTRTISSTRLNYPKLMQTLASKFNEIKDSKEAQSKVDSLSRHSRSVIISPRKRIDLLTEIPDNFILVESPTTIINTRRSENTLTNIEPVQAVSTFNVKPGSLKLKNLETINTIPKSNELLPHNTKDRVSNNGRNKIGQLNDPSDLTKNCARNNLQSETDICEHEDMLVPVSDDGKNKNIIKLEANCVESNTKLKTKIPVLLATKSKPDKLEKSSFEDNSTLDGETKSNNDGFKEIKSKLLDEKDIESYKKVNFKTSANDNKAQNVLSEYSNNVVAKKTEIQSHSKEELKISTKPNVNQGDEHRLNILMQNEQNVTKGAILTDSCVMSQKTNISKEAKKIEPCTTNSLKDRPPTIKEHCKKSGDHGIEENRNLKERIRKVQLKQKTRFLKDNVKNEDAVRNAERAIERKRQWINEKLNNSQKDDSKLNIAAKEESINKNIKTKTFEGNGKLDVKIKSTSVSQYNVRTGAKNKNVEKDFDIELIKHLSVEQLRKPIPKQGISKNNENMSVGHIKDLEGDICKIEETNADFIMKRKAVKTPLTDIVKSSIGRQFRLMETLTDAIKVAMHVKGFEKLEECIELIDASITDKNEETTQEIVDIDLASEKSKKLVRIDNVDKTLKETHRLSKSVLVNSDTKISKSNLMSINKNKSTAEPYAMADTFKLKKMGKELNSGKLTNKLNTVANTSCSDNKIPLKFEELIQAKINKIEEKLLAVSEDFKDIVANQSKLKKQTTPPLTTKLNPIENVKEHDILVDNVCNLNIVNKYPKALKNSVPLKILTNSLWNWETQFLNKSNICPAEITNKINIQSKKQLDSAQSITPTKKYRYETKETISAEGKKMSVTYLVAETNV